MAEQRKRQSENDRFPILSNRFCLQWETFVLTLLNKKDDDANGYYKNSDMTLTKLYKMISHINMRPPRKRQTKQTSKFDFKTCFLIK